MIKVSVIKPFVGNFPVTSPFGERIDPISSVKKIHNGIDFGCPEGTPIRSVLDGKIFMSGWECEKDHGLGYGRRVWIESKLDGKQFLIVYAHLSKIQRWTGDILKNEIIGLSGNTGKSTGAHLHLGCRIKNSSQFVDFTFIADEVKNG